MNMMTKMALRHRPLSDAKAQLSEVMSQVVREHRPTVVDRHRGKEAMLLLGADQAHALLERYRFDTQTRFENGEWTLFSPELKLVASGESFDEALDELVGLSDQYAADYFDRLAFYLETDRAPEFGWLLRFALTAEDKRRDLFTEPPAAAVRASE